MSRTKIRFEDKKQELLQSIWKILLKDGYEKMTIAVIMNELGISKGAFYHYFQSKEDCVDQAIRFYVQKSIQELEKHDRPEAPPVMRLQKAIADGVFLFHEETAENQFLHQPENSIFHQKLMAVTVKMLAPYYAVIIKQGVLSNEFAVSSPLETAEMLLTLMNFYLNASIFQWEPADMAVKIHALEELANKALGTREYVPLLDFETPKHL